MTVPIQLYQQYTSNFDSTIHTVVGEEHMKCGKLYELSFAGGYVFRKPCEIEEDYTLINEDTIEESV